MGFTDKKFEIAIAGFAVLMIGGMGYLLKAPVQAAVSELEVVYEMPRPKSFLAALFELGDREVSREYKNPFANKKKEAAKPADPKTAKAEEAKKPTTIKKVVKKSDAQDKKPEVDVQIVGSQPTGPSFSDDSIVGGGSSAAYAADAQTGKANTSGTNNPNATSGMDGDQWRALVLAQPTTENIAKLVAAYQAQEITEASFYQIVGELLSDNKTETQKMGLLAAKSVYSAKSFTLVAQNYDHMTTEMQATAHTYLMSYTTTTRLGFLKSALQSSDGDVVATATTVVIAGYQAAKSGSTAVDLADPRNSRGDVVTNSVGGYSQFITIFQQLAQSQDETIRGLASNALSQIQSSAAVASL